MCRLSLRSSHCSIHEAQVWNREVDRRNCLSSCSAKKPIVFRSTRNAHPLLDLPLQPARASDGLPCALKLALRNLAQFSACFAKGSA